MTIQESEDLLGKPKETPSIPAGKITPGALNSFNTKQRAHFSHNREKKLQKLELKRKKERRETSHFPDQEGLSKETRVMIVVYA